MPELLRPLRGRARWAIAAIAAVMVADLATIGSDLLEIARRVATMPVVPQPPSPGY